MPKSGYSQTPEHKEKIAASQQGKKHSAETCAKKSVALKGRPQPVGHIDSQRETKLANGTWCPIGTIYTRKKKNRQDQFIKVAHGQGYKNWMLYHRFVMEQHLGRSLEEHEQVHHLDGNPINNEIDNLCLVSRTDHCLITKLLKSVDRALAKTIVRTLLERFPGLLDD